MSNNTHIKTILVLAANPTNTVRLQLDKEIREIDEGLRRANKREQFKLEQKWAVQVRDFYRAILDNQPYIVHFCGHSAGEDGIVLVDEMGQITFMQTDVLAAMFKLFASKGVECVVLNACYSEVQAEAISQHINYVIGMNRAIGDEAAINFTMAFYDALGAGEEVEFAFELGCSQLIGLKEHQTPVLKKKFKKIGTEVESVELESELSEIELFSKKEVNYTNLHNLLLAGQWKEADKETARVMLIATSREKEGWLNRESIEQFSCEDLRIIDQLWVKYSDGRFGFSIQKQIWQGLQKSLDETQFINSYYTDFYRNNFLFKRRSLNSWISQRKIEILEDNLKERVGWLVGGTVVSYEKLIFSLDAPFGHLPAIKPTKKPHGGWWRLEVGWGRHPIFERAETCGLF